MEREKMNLSKIHHIAIIVSDYEAAKYSSWFLKISPEKVRPGMKTKGLPSPFFQDM